MFVVFGPFEWNSGVFFILVFFFFSTPLFALHPGVFLTFMRSLPRYVLKTQRWRTHHCELPWYVLHHCVVHQTLDNLNTWSQSVSAVHFHIYSFPFKKWIDSESTWPQEPESNQMLYVFLLSAWAAKLSQLWKCCNIAERSLMNWTQH